MLSGIGPSDVPTPAKIAVKKYLPAAGSTRQATMFSVAEKAADIFKGVR
jgi:hypothetical protein